MNNYIIILKALFKNKFRFSESNSKGKKLAFFLLFGLVYLMVVAFAVSVIVLLKDVFLQFTVIVQKFYFFVLMSSAVVVLFFGIIHLISMLYLSKDTDFYSMLPVKPSTVFFAKLSYVYLCEAAIVLAIAFPVLMVLGIVAKMWVWYYIITILTLLIVPVFPLVVAAIVAVPVMLIASKLKNRNVISLVFYMLLFGLFFSAYIYFIYLSSSSELTAESMTAMLNAMKAVEYALYPYTVLANAVCGISMYGLNMGASTVVAAGVFVGISAALLVIIWFLAKLMYAQSAKANNQTDNSKAKVGEFKSTTSMRALIKREYISSLRTTQVAFQCYVVLLLPVVMSIILSLMTKSSIVVGEDMEYINNYLRIIPFCTLCAILSTVGNGASTTFSREGTAFASLKVLPVDIETVVKAKVAAWTMLAVPVTIVSVVIINAMNFDLACMFLSFFSLVPISVVFIIFGVLWDLKAPSLKWTDPMQAIKHNMHVFGGQMIMMTGGLISIFVSTALFFVELQSAVINAVFWALIYSVLVIFAVVDFVLYKKVNEFYSRIEI
ncbi:MAG: hypothetical protein J1F71_00825 [Clostridiales bacterium]|nr:hypothetical protein [Clostridiales bacterium]